MGVRINHIDGTAVCDEHGETDCEHIWRLHQRFGAWAYHLEQRARRDEATDGHPREVRAARVTAGVLGRDQAILTALVERPLAARPDERPLRNTKDNE